MINWSWIWIYDIIKRNASFNAILMSLGWSNGNIFIIRTFRTVCMIRNPIRQWKWICRQLSCPGACNRSNGSRSVNRCGYDWYRMCVVNRYVPKHQLRQIIFIHIRFCSESHFWSSYDFSDFIFWSVSRSLVIRILIIVQLESQTLNFSSNSKITITCRFIPLELCQWYSEFPLLISYSAKVLLWDASFMTSNC
jgi:hypothetical protein